MPDAPNATIVAFAPERIMTADVVSTDDVGLARTIEVLRSGGVVVLPTETVYGLAALAGVDDAVARLFALKGRDADVPIAVLCATAADAFALAAPIAPQVEALGDALWPGPLTLVLPRRRDLTWELGQPSTTVGVRCPDHDFVRAVAAAVGPIATTSANRHGLATPAAAETAAKSLFGPVDLVVDGGARRGTPSTVLDATVIPPVVLRQGALHIDLA